MKSKIYCTNNVKGTHKFYISHKGEEYYLFSQNFKKGVYNYFSTGVMLDDALDYSKSHYDTAIKKTMSKIPMYLRYIEQEYGIVLLRKTERKSKYQIAS